MTLKTVLEMLKYSTLSYNDVQPPNKGEELIFIEDEIRSVQCFVRKSCERMLITFRGTDSCIDMMSDLSFWKKKVPYSNIESKIRVHSGFVDAYKRECVRDKLHSLITKDIDKIQITGHSYGAALSVLCAVDLQYNFPDKDYEVVLFGCPRVGNVWFSRSYNRRVKKTLRVENGNDLVTKIPFSFMGFCHVGEKFHIGKIRIPLWFSLLNHRQEAYHKALTSNYLDNKLAFQKLALDWN